MTKGKMLALKISQDKRFIVREDGSGFFWLADTAWELFFKLDREEAGLYLKNRAGKGFNVIQAVATGVNSGLSIPNAYGRLPFLKNKKGQYDPSMPDAQNTEDCSYWDHVDYIIGKAAELGIYVALAPAWGHNFNRMNGKGPEIFTEDNAKAYGRWIGERYKDTPNIIWILGGDRPLYTSQHFAVVNGMAEGIRETDSGNHLMTFHPYGQQSSTLHVHNENWLDFNMVQSAHNALNFPNYSFIEKDYMRLPAKPVLDGEPRYEDHPVLHKPENGYFDDFDVRQAAYWSVFAGACGHTYGNHCIWTMCTEPGDFFVMTWKAALDRPGAVQMKYLKALVESRPFTESVPDQSVIMENPPGASHMQARRGRSFLYVYNPNGLKIKLEMGKISGSKVKANWFNPRAGEYTFEGIFENNGVAEFIPPSSGRNNDWVLMLEETDR